MYTTHKYCIWRQKIKGLTSLAPEVAKDLIELINSMAGLEKTKSATYPTKKGGLISFDYVPLDDILSKIKKNNNFALLQPIGVDENNRNGVKCVLVHKSGHVIETDTYPFANNSESLQAEGGEVTYRKRYALGSFLGLATEDDNDGGQAQTHTRKATQKQIDTINKYCDKKKLDEILHNKQLKNIEDISVIEASEIIKGILQKQGEKNVK